MKPTGQKDIAPTPPGWLHRLPLIKAWGGSLRARLTLALASISVITLFLAGSAFVLILSDYQIKRETNRIAELTLPLSNQVRSLEQLGATTQEIVEYLERQAEELDLRVVLADTRGRVFADTEDTLIGRRLDIENPPRFGLQRRVRQAAVEGPQGEIGFMVSPSINPPAPQSATTPGPGSSVGERFLGRQSAYIIGLSVPRHSIASAWLELLPRLSLAAFLALLLSIGVAWPLAASIARPLAGMTQAAEGIAQGRFDQLIPERGRDEVARLAGAFNRMTTEVNRSQRTLRDFLANVSHDLRTPLTSIQGFSQALTDGTLSEKSEVAEAGRIVNQEAERMNSLVGDLLYLSKIESGQAPLERHELNAAPLVSERVEAALHRAAEKGVELRWGPSEAPGVFADRGRLERVVDNLLDNALRHTPAGGKVSVALADWEAGAGALLSVHNTGSVVPPEDLPRVFERFYQVDKARAAGSSGLGLAIIREVVHAHGGRCWAESSREAGTTFFALLPAARKTATNPPRHDPFGVPEPVIGMGTAETT